MLAVSWKGHTLTKLPECSKSPNQTLVIGIVYYYSSPLLKCHCTEHLAPDNSIEMLRRGKYNNTFAFPDNLTKNMNL